MMRVLVFPLVSLFFSQIAFAAAPPAKSADKPLKWHDNWTVASAEARKTDRLILMYFCGSDWDPYTEKLGKDVLKTKRFTDWARENVVLFEVDFPNEKRQNPQLKAQNDRLKQRYRVDKVPTFIFVDADGEPYVRCGYDAAKLRDHEKAGEPQEWIKFIDGVVQTRPGREELRVQESFNEAREYAKSRGLLLLLLITKDKTPGVLANNKAVLGSQGFIRFVNRTMVFYSWDWPEELSLSPEASQFKKFIEEHKIGPAAAQFVVYDPGKNEVRKRILSFAPNHVVALRKQLEKELPKFDYTGGWLTDFHKAQAVASQMKREVFVAFTSMDSSEWCQLMDTEIFKTPEFQNYANQHLVLCRIDFPKTKPLAPAVADENRRLAELYRIKGYPSVVILNDGGQKIGAARYQKGGPQPLLKEIEELRRQDYERRTHMSDQVEVVP